MYKEGVYCDCDYKVDEFGDCYTRNGKGEYIHRSWRYNSDGYPVVSACGIGVNSKKDSKVFTSTHFSSARICRWLV